MFTLKCIVFVLCAAALLTGISNAQQITTRTNSNRPTVTGLNGHSRTFLRHQR